MQHNPEKKVNLKMGSIFRLHNICLITNALCRKILWIFGAKIHIQVLAGYSNYVLYFWRKNSKISFCFEFWNWNLLNIVINVEKYNEVIKLSLSWQRFLLETCLASGLTSLFVLVVVITYANHHHLLKKLQEAQDGWHFMPCSALKK